MYGEVYVSERTMHVRLQDRHRESESRRLVRQARAHATGLRSSVGRWLLSQMSYRLMAVGARLVSLGLHPYLPAQQELKRNGSSRATA